MIWLCITIHEGDAAVEEFQDVWFCAKAIETVCDGYQALKFMRWSANAKPGQVLHFNSGWVVCCTEVFK